MGETPLLMFFLHVLFLQSLFITIAFLKSLASTFPWSFLPHLVLADSTKLTNLVAKIHNIILPTILCGGNRIKCFWGGHCIIAGDNGTTVCPVPLSRWWQFCPMKNNSLSFFQQSSKASSVPCSGSFTAMQSPLHESHGCPCFNSIANYTHKFRVQLIVVLWSRCFSGKKKLICKHADALLSRGLFILGEE